mgnify:CR=1 FL=1
MLKSLPKGIFCAQSCQGKYHRFIKVIFDSRLMPNLHKFTASLVSNTYTSLGSRLSWICHNRARYHPQRAINHEPLSPENRYHRRVLAHSLNLPPKKKGRALRETYARALCFPPILGGDLTNVPRLSCDSGSWLIARWG